MIKLKETKRLLDIELTDRCNAQCSFCPRDQTPGQGEPTLHPQIVEFAQHVNSVGIPYSITTNSSLLTEELAEGLLDAKVKQINFSISDLGDDYEEVYALNFDNTRANIFRFLDMNEARGKPVRAQINVVAHDLNRDKLKLRRWM